MCKLRGHKRSVSAQGADPADPTGHRRSAIADAGGSTDSGPSLHGGGCVDGLMRGACMKAGESTSRGLGYEPPNDILGRAIDVRVVQHLSAARIKVVPADAYCIMMHRMLYAARRLRVTCCSCVLRESSGTAPLVSYRGGTHTGLCVYPACMRALAGGRTRSPGSHSLSR